MSQPEIKKHLHRETASIEGLISRMLQVGIIACAVITATGLLLLFVTGHGGYPEGVFPASFSQVFTGLWQLKPFAVISLGLLVLIATPFLWVAATIIAFAWGRDKSFTLISGYVLMVLVLSLILGRVQ